jgi:hypothetical protein
LSLSSKMAILARVVSSGIGVVVGVVRSLSGQSR